MSDQQPARSTFLSRIIGVVAILAAHFFALCVLVMVLCSVVPVYSRFFEVHDLELPNIAFSTIQLSYLCNNYWYLLFIFGMPIDAVIVFVLSSLGAKRSWILQVYCHLWLLAVILLLLFVIVSMSVPINRMVNTGLLT